MRSSPFADAIEAELWGNLEFPDLPCLHHARQILVSSPALLAVANGQFTSAAVRSDAARKGFKPSTYRGVEMWISTGKSDLSIARLNDQLLLIGSMKTIQASIDNSAAESARQYSPLLSRAARFTGKDLWGVASQLPDPLASRFVPLDAEARCFEGSLTTKNGLELDASLCARSEKEAAQTAQKLQKSVPSFASIAKNLEVKAEKDTVLLALSVSPEQMSASLQKSAQPITAQSAAVPSETVKVETPKRVETVAVETVRHDKPVPPPASAPLAAPEQPKKSEPQKPQEMKPQVIRIVGLDDGPKEIVLPPAKPDKSENPS